MIVKSSIVLAVFASFVLVNMAQAAGSDHDTERRLKALEARVEAAASLPAGSGLEARLSRLEAQLANSNGIIQEINQEVTAVRQMAVTALNGQQDTLQRSLANGTGAGASAARAELEPLRAKLAELEVLQRRLATAESGVQQTSTAVTELKSTARQQGEDLTLLRRSLQYVNRIPDIETQVSGQGSALTDLKQQVSGLGEAGTAVQARLDSVNQALLAQATVVEGLVAQDQQLSHQITTVQSLAAGGAGGVLKTAAVVTAPVSSCDSLKNSDTRAWQAALDRIGGGLKILSVDFPAHVAYVRTTKGNREAIRTIDVLERSGCL